MMYATICYNGKEEICSVDPVGNRVFLLSEFFKSRKTMNEFIEEYKDEWTDQIAYFFGTNPDLSIPLDEVKLLAPVPNPKRNLICVGKNFVAHANELDDKIFSDNVPKYPIYFSKPDHTLIATEEDILLHENITKEVDYEVELAVVIGKNGTDIPAEEAEEYIFGYSIANDISARDLQNRHEQWYKGKSLTTHCPMGPWIVHKSMLPLPLSLELKCYVNDELRQHANAKDMVFDIPTLISDLSRGFELKAGDILLTGTPAGVGMAFDPPKYLKSGDLVKCEIEKIGVLSNRVK
jgi:2-keto-4-pentenoate hydratase/2-oxohepta-3-ene-1,7-dioic acid hydratase in catechol pathway